MDDGPRRGTMKMIRSFWLSCFLLTFLLHPSSCHRLLLVEEHELLRSKPHSSEWQLILQNPFPGSVNFEQSESDRFQILFNVSGSGEHVGYNVTRDLNSIRVHLQNFRNRLFGSASGVVDVESIHFLFIYAIAAACLVGLSTASGLFFLICWNGQRRHRSGSHGVPGRGREADATKMPLLVSEPTTPHVSKHHFSDNAMTDGAIATMPRYSEGTAQKRWIHPSSESYVRNNEEDDYVASTLVGGGHWPLRGSSTARPTTSILKRPGGFVGGSSGGGGTSSGGSSSLDRASFHSAGSANVSVSAASVPLSMLPSNPIPGPSSRCSDSTTDLDSNDSRKMGSGGSSTSSRPRHIAREFLDEGTLSSRSGGRRGVPSGGGGVGGSGIGGPTGPSVLTTSLPVSTCIPAAPLTVQAAAVTSTGVVPVSGGAGSLLSIGMLTPGVLAKESPSPLPEPPHFEPGFMYQSGKSSAQGSDETSGIISDSDVSSLERQQQSQSSTSSSNNKLSSSLSGAPGSSLGPERYISLASNDERYIALNVPASSPSVPETISTSSTVPPIDSNNGVATVPRRASAGGGAVVSGGPSTPTLRPMAGSYTSSSTLSSASSVQTVLAADEFSGLGSNGGPGATSSLGRPFRGGMTPVPPERSVSLKTSASFGDGGFDHTEEDDEDPPLPPPPSSTTSPRSALKGSRPPGPPINKQLRFTTLTLLALLCLTSSGVCAMVAQSRAEPEVKVTIFLPKSLFHSAKELSMVLLYLNRTYRTEVNFNNFPRERVEIYDVVDANHYVHKTMCRSRYSCQHTCDPGLGYRCMCERGYELMDNIRCKDENECLDSENACQSSRKKCNNLAGHFECVCPVGARGLTCGDCGSPCKPGFYIWQNCTENHPRVCRGCDPLCRSDQYEFLPCTRSTNRVCRSRASLPGIRLPFKDNIWYEDLARVIDVSTPNLIASPRNRTLVLDRGSGYSVKLQFVRDLNVAPVLEPEDHSRANDNAHFESRDPRNRTLMHHCPYPLTKYYNLMMRTHLNVMSMAEMDHNLPGYRPTLRPCRTYRQFGQAPEVRAGVPCVQPGALPGLFGRDKNDMLAKYLGVYVDKGPYCHRSYEDCHRCLMSCVGHMNKTSLCMPLAEPGDNALSPRLEKCFNCCAKDNCSSVCETYLRSKCKPKLCMRGPLLEFELRPTWPDTAGGRFYCHMRLRQREPVYHLRFWLYREGVQLRQQPFVALLHPPQNKVQPVLRETYQFLTANYHTGLSELPDVVGGDGTAQVGYRWSSDGTPVMPPLGSGRGWSRGGVGATGIPVWTRTPMALNSASWARLSCGAAQRALGDLFREQGIEPLVPIPHMQVSLTGRYQYKVTRAGVRPQVNFTVPRSASVLSALFKPTYVHRGDYLRADLLLDRSAGRGGHRWVVRVSGAVAAKPGLFRVRLYQAVEPVGLPLYDYEVGVYQERRFQVEFVIPAPDVEPAYTKAFKILLIDTKGTMQLRVERPPQNSVKLAEVRRFQASSVPRPDVFPSVGVEQQDQSDGLYLLGVPDRLWWAVIGSIVLLCFLLLVGHLTEPTEMILGRKGSSKTNDPTEPSCWHRFLFMLYMILKSIYSFSITLTALLIVARVLTDLPSHQPTSYENFFSNITVHERLLLDRMDRHLTLELFRQRDWVEKRKRVCEARLNETYGQLEKYLATLSSGSAWRRAQVHVSRAVLERARAQVRNLSLALQRGREQFEQAAQDAVIQLMSDIKSTHKRLVTNSWLAGARKIHNLVRSQRSNQPGFQIKPFERWAKIDVTLSSVKPSLGLSADLPLPNASELTLEDLSLPSYQPYKEQLLELDRNIWYVRDESVGQGVSASRPGGSGGRIEPGDVSPGGGLDDGGAAPLPPVKLTWHHLLGVALTIDALLLLYRLLHALDRAQQILNGAPMVIDCTRSSLTRNRKGEVIQPDWRIKMKRTFVTTMESDFVPLAVVSAFAYLFIFLMSSYSHDLVSEHSLDSVGFYDNLVLPVHARHRLVNTHIATQAERANQVELAHFERSANARFEQYQFILSEWRDWLTRLERAQCQQLLLYKERQAGVPRHCEDFDFVRREMSAEKLNFGGCSLEKVQPKLFEGYDEGPYFDSIVENSRPFIASVRTWLANLTFTIFSFVSAIVLWNLLGACVWFYLRRWNVILQKDIYEVDLKGSF